MATQGCFRNVRFATTRSHTLVLNALHDLLQGEKSTRHDLQTDMYTNPVVCDTCAAAMLPIQSSADLATAPLCVGFPAQALKCAETCFRHIGRFHPNLVVLRSQIKSIENFSSFHLRHNIFEQREARQNFSGDTIDSSKIAYCPQAASIWLWH